VRMAVIGYHTYWTYGKEIKTIEVTECCNYVYKNTSSTHYEIQPVLYIGSIVRPESPLVGFAYAPQKAITDSDVRSGRLYVYVTCIYSNPVTCRARLRTKKEADFDFRTFKICC
jgi:hypothetical protein